MARGRRPSYDWQPMTMTRAEVAIVVFRRSESWLLNHIPQNFPKPHPIYDLFATEAVLAWVRLEFGLVTVGGEHKDAEARLLGKLARGESQNSVPGRSAA
jgi:hypothetical protein